MRIYYLVPNRDVPSWGLAMLYQHVQILNLNGFKAFIIKEFPLKAPDWLDVNVPIESLVNFSVNVKSSDYLIVPEVMIDLPNLKTINCNKIVFIQAGAYIFERMPLREDHVSLGFKHVWVIMPHLAEIVERHINLPYTLIPAFVAQYFFTNSISNKRRKQILLYPKSHEVDHSIVNYLLQKFLRTINNSRVKDFFKNENWKIVELKNLKHKNVAIEMQRSAFFISLNTFEALNTSIVEAMASGSIVFCYEAFGPRDYLKDKINAFCFRNHEVYKLVDTLCDQINNYNKEEGHLKLMQENAYKTAKVYSKENTEKSLITFFSDVH